MNLSFLGQMGLGMLNTGLNYAMSKEDREWSLNAQMALQKNAQEWMADMSNTAHQREMADLQAAGLNPLLTATGGNGASTPSSTAGQAPQSNRVQMAQQAFANGLNSMQVKSNVELQKAQAMQAQATATAQSTQASLNETASSLNIVNNALKNKELEYYDREKLQKIKGMILDNVNKHVSTNLMKSEIEQKAYQNDLLNEQTKYQRGKTALLGKPKSETSENAHNWSFRIWGGSGGKSNSWSYTNYD